MVKTDIARLNKPYYQNWLRLRFKISKLLRLLPMPQKQVLSVFEDQGFRDRFYRDLWKNAASSLDLPYTDLGYGYWRVDQGETSACGDLTSIELDTQISLIISGNKPLSHQLCSEVDGYLVPKYKEFDLGSIDKAASFLLSRSISCVIKPAQDTGAGSGVITGIDSLKKLIDGAVKISTYCKKLMIEETVIGNSYRVLILGGQYLGAIRRDPPCVIGDGVSSIRKLIEKENGRRLNSSKIVSLFPILIDEDCHHSLAARNLSLTSIPAEAEIIKVKDVINQNAAEQNVDVSDSVHPGIIKTSIDASQRLGLKLAGVDVLCADISKPLAETGGIINEVNGNPGLHHHYLIRDQQKIPIAEKILQFVLDNNKD